MFIVAVRPNVMSDATQFATLDQDLHCPVCDYNLRGLIHPRCPECGHAFVLRKLLDAGKLHPYLFEHRYQGLDAIIRTCWHSFWPGRFWRALNRSIEPRVARMLFYALVVLGMAMLLLLLPLFFLFVDECKGWGLMAFAQLPRLTRDRDICTAFTAGAIIVSLW